jgi:hypothetical protein
LIVRRQSNIFFYFVGLGSFILGLVVLDAGFRRWHDKPEALQRAEIVKVLSLTDLCLVTEARYTRHPSLADPHTPFQEHPLSLEHFPSGSFIAVPPQLRGQVPK